ncbi:hypothetical protein BXZ70DRAFT_1011949 [Cristinia sonorae]|uniref:Uncharacterized protein n=1 Tax=Cristinia sonorae TaxID=1940300 RepID=A0A8K0UG46_9AGAR|nr:hypothetical protein BXZ70DRAFT_1011949 [Cristinia sonorae]
MSLGDADAKFPHSTANGLPPSPSRENPGQVFPKSDPKAAPAESVPGTGGENEPSSLMSNPFALQSVFGKLDDALGGVISALESEEKSAGSSANEDATVAKFKQWKTELDQISRSGQVAQQPRAEDNSIVQQEGGLFTD